MGARELLTSIAGVALSLLALGAGSEAQTIRPNDSFQKRHLMAVRAERTTVLLSAWEAATPERRALAEKALLDARGRGRPAGRRPELSDLARATRILQGQEPGAVLGDQVEHFVDSLDLQVVPGAFSATLAGRGVPLTVRVYRLWQEGTLPGTFELELTWVGPNGQRIRARREPFHAEAFDPPGFDMYLRAPLSEPDDTWSLVPELTHRDRTASGPGVPVEAVRDLAGRMSAYEPSGAGEPDLELLVAKGLRIPATSPPSSWLAADELGTASGDPVFRSDLGAALRPWTITPDLASGRPTLVVLAPGGESSLSLFAAPGGGLWRALAEERRVGVVSLELTSAQAPLFVEALERLSEAGPAIVVARGDSATLLHLVLARNAAPLAGLVLCSTIAPGPALPEVPILIVGGADAPESEGVRRVAGSEVPLLNELALPGRMGDWLASLEERGVLGARTEKAPR